MGLFKRKGRLSLAKRKRKYAREIRTKVEMRNNGKPYVNKNGEVKPLSNTQLSFRSGYFTAIKDMIRQRKKSSKKKNKSSKMETYVFSAFNSDCKMFNVSVKGRNRKEALNFARRHLKKDPRYKGHTVTICNTNGNVNEFFRILEVSRNGKVIDNFPPKIGRAHV